MITRVIMQVFKMIIETPEVVKISLSLCLAKCITMIFIIKIKCLSWFKAVSFFFVSSNWSFVRVCSSWNLQNSTELLGFIAVGFVVFHFPEANCILSHKWFPFERFKWGVNLFHFLSWTAKSLFSLLDCRYHCYFSFLSSLPQVSKPEHLSWVPKLLFICLALDVRRSNTISRKEFSIETWKILNIFLVLPLA